MNIKFANNSQYTFEEVIEAREVGGKFVTYQWFIPLPLFPPVRRLSKVYFIPPQKNASSHAWRFNIVSLLIGWWGLPWGPVYVFRSLRINNGGGIDVSDDVYLNIDEHNYKAGRLHIVSTVASFLHPSKSDIKEYTKVFHTLIKSGIINDGPIIGLDMNTDNAPYLLIGFNESIDEIEKIISDAIYKRFYKHTKFELVDLSSDFESKEKFISQGLKIDCG